MTPGATPPAAEPSGPVPLRHRTAAGFVWTAVSVAANKLIGFVAQLVLARLLTQDDFGRIALTLTVANFVLLLREAGVTDVLVQRGVGFDDWAGPALGLVSVLSVVTGVLLAAVAPLAAHWYADARLSPILYVIAATCPLAGLGNVAAARLTHELRFHELGLVATAVTVVQGVVQTAFALDGFGAISFAWGLLLSNVVRLVWLWSLGRPRGVRFFDVRAWAALLADSRWVLASGVLTTVVQQGDYLVLSLTQPAAVVGVYYFAFNLSTQAYQLVTVSLANVLLPALSRFRAGAAVQTERFLEATEMLAYVGVPLCVLQALVCRSLLAAFFGHRWEAAVLPLQLLSVAMIPAVIGGNGATLLKAQGRFRACLELAAASALIFIACVATAALLGAAAAVATGVIVAYSVIAVVGMVWSAGATRAAVRRVAVLFVLPPSLAAAAALPAVGVGRLTDGGPAYVAVVLPAFTAAYLLLLRRTRPAVWRAFMQWPRAR